MSEHYCDLCRCSLGDLPLTVSDCADKDCPHIERIDPKNPPLPAGAKPSNPKDALGILKVPLSTVSAPVLWELGLAMLEGALKYGRHNYRVVGVRASVYYDAVMARHLPSWWEGEDIDPASGVHHVTKAIASLVVLRDSMIRGNWVDDRPPRIDPKLIDEMNARVEALLKKYPNPVPPFTEVGEKAKALTAKAGRV